MQVVKKLVFFAYCLKDLMEENKDGQGEF